MGDMPERVRLGRSVSGRLVDFGDPDGEEYVRADREAKLVAALQLARNRLQRRAVDFPMGSILSMETGEWADEISCTLKELGHGG